MEVLSTELGNIFPPVAAWCLKEFEESERVTLVFRIGSNEFSMQPPIPMRRKLGGRGSRDSFH